MPMLASVVTNMYAMASDTDDNTPVLGMPVIVLLQRVC